MIAPGAVVTLDIEKPAAGGRMLARHHGQIVLVANAIPGERVRARVERAGKHVAFAETTEVITASSDRRTAVDWRCGGNVLSHVAYARQLQLKAQIIQDAFVRIGRMPLPPPAVAASPELGYRMRARLHARGGRFGFYREGTHDLCDPGPTGQLLPATIAWLHEVEARLDPAAAGGIVGLELSEDIAGGQRAAWLDTRTDVDASWFSELAGPEVVIDRLEVPGVREPVELRRGARSFFQGNRFLVEQIVHHVATLVPEGPVVDLYAGVGLFGLVLAARGAEWVTLVEGDQASGQDLVANARPYLERVRVARVSVEAFLGAAGSPLPRREPRPVFLVDPPRTGLSKEAMAGLVAAAPDRLIYVSCDVATLARDARVLLDAGYELGTVTGFDLFPNTAHVETVVPFDRAEAPATAAGLRAGAPA